MPDRNDKFVGDQCRIRVTGDRYFHLFSDDPNEISLDAIATATSRLCRFTGHLLPGIEIYSVAEHSILVSHIVEQMGAPPDVVMQALLHDASEAYLADIAAPFKGHVEGYHSVEDRIMERVKEHFLLPQKTDPRVKLADWYALFIEARQIVTFDEEVLKTWQGYAEHGAESWKYQNTVKCWLPSMARVQFLMRFAVVQDMMLRAPWHITEKPEQLEFDFEACRAAP